MSEEEEPSETGLDSAQDVARLARHTGKAERSLAAELEIACGQKAELEKKLALQSGITKSANALCNASIERLFKLGKRAYIRAFRQNKSSKNDLFNDSKRKR